MRLEDLRLKVCLELYMYKLTHDLLTCEEKIRLVHFFAHHSFTEISTHT